METVRGEEANNMIGYGTPDEGYEFMAVKIAYSVISTKGDFSVSASSAYFDCFTSNNEETPRSYASLKASIQPLQGELYSGGNAEGWIVVQVKKDDKSPKLAYGLDYNGTNGIWFKLYE